MRKHAIYLTLFATACICAVAVIGQTANYVPADRNQTANIRGAGTTIMPLSHLREYDPVTVFFDRDAVPGDPGPITPSAQLLSITPAHPGEFIRIDARTLEFRPAIPWEPLKRYRFVSGRVTRELVTLLTPPHSVSPERGSTDLEPVNSVGLEFNTKVGAQALSRLVSIEVCALPGVDGRGCRTLRPAEYRVRETVRGASDYLYRFTFNEPVGYGNRVRVSLRLTERAEFADAQWSYTFETRPEFAMERAGTFRQMFTLGTGGIAYESRQALRLDFDRELVVEFSAPPADPGLSAIRNMVTLTPAPSDFQYRIDGNRVIINLGIEQEKMYRVTLNPVPIRDRAGRSLTNRRPNSFYVFLPQAAPFARWGRGDASGVGIGIVEQFGPQHFPIRTRGISTLDFRVYRIDPLHSAFRSFPRHEPVSVRESARPPGPGEEPGGLDSTLAQANRWSRDHLLLGELEKHIMMLGSPHYSAVLDLEKEGVNRFQSVDLKPMLTAAAGGSNRPGSYLVGFRMLEGSDSRRHYVRVDVTDLCLSVVESKNRALFGVTSYSSGRPVPDARITVYGIVNDSTAVLAQGRTGQDGFFTLEHTAAVRERFRRADIRNIVVSKGDDVLTLATSGGRGLQVFADNHWYGRYGALDWLKGEEYSDERDKNLRGFVRTERPIYRPEDSVFIKGYVRETVHGNIDLPPRGLSYQVRVHAPSQKYVDYPVTLNEYGSFDLRIAPHEQATGDYRITLMADAQRQNRGSQIATTDFVVEAYRIPRFEVRMSGADRIPNDAPAEIRAAASYYAGGRVAGQEIAWKITSYPYTHRPDGFPGYILSSDGRYGAVSERRRQSVSEENGKTDETGSARLTLNPQAATAGNPVRYVVEATVTDADRQTVSARHAVVALPPFILGLKTDRHITSGNAISAEVVAIGVNDSLVAGQRVNVELKRVTWTSYLAETDFSQGRPKYITDESVELVEERVITTTDKPVPVEFKDQQPGVYIIELSSRDRLGRLQSIRVDLFLPGSGQQAQAWRRAEQNLFETIKDRTSYDPGQQARILIKSPYRRAVALAVAEKPDGGLLYQWINIVDGQGTFTLDIKKEMSPRIPVSFLLMRPRVSEPSRTPDGVQADVGKPETMGNTTWLTVNPVANKLDVKLAHAPVVTPDGTLDVVINLTDAQGRPQSGEVALWLVDEAVLSLRREKSLDPLEAFIEPVFSRISLRDSRNLAFGSLHTRENSGGDGGDFDDDDGLGRMTVRQNFKTVPYWNPSIKVDRSGQATVRIRMSSDLTNYAVRAIAVSGPDRFGTARGRVSVRLPVIVQPALPRFVRLGDRIKAGGIARVVEGPGGAGSWSIRASGLTVKSAASGQIQLDAARPVPLIADLQVETPPFTPDGRLQWDSVSVRMSVMRSADRAGDAFEVKIPVLPDRHFIEEALFARIDKRENFTWAALPEPARANTVLSHLLISDNEYLPKIISAMTNQVRYPHTCTEQVVSQTYPFLVYTDVWEKYGIAPPDPSVAENVNRTVEFLKTAQHSDGLFGYWPGTPGYVYLTAYIVDFLTEVGNANKTLRQPFAFDQTMYALAIEALKRSLRSDYARFVSGHAAHERTAALAALSRSGHLDIGYARELTAAARELDIQGMSNVFQAIAGKKDALGSEHAALEKRLWESVIFAERQGAEAFAGFQRPGAPVGARMHSSDAVVLASFVSAVSSSQPVDNRNRQRMPLVVDALVKMGGAADAWGSVHANSVSLLALRGFVDNVGITTNNTFDFNDGAASRRLTMDGAFSQHWSSDKAGGITYTGQPDRAFWAKFSRRYMPRDLGSSAEPQQRGFAVRREMIRIHKDAPPARTAIDKGGNTLTFTTGDIVEEHVQVVNPETRLFVAVSVPIAAGFEPMNPRLENASSDARPMNRSTNEGDYRAFFDDRVVYFFERMEQGTYNFYFRTQAITEGEFSHPPAKAEMMYQMSVYGTSAGSRIVVGGR